MVSLIVFQYFPFRSRVKRKCASANLLINYSVNKFYFLNRAIFVVYDELCENSQKNILKLIDNAIIITFVGYFLVNLN